MAKPEEQPLQQFGTSERICQLDGSNDKKSEYHAAVELAQISRWNGIKQRHCDLLQLYLQHPASVMKFLSLQPSIETAVASSLMLELKHPIFESMSAVETENPRA
jgi:hypothetical protein